MLNPNFAASKLSYVKLLLFIWIYICKVNKIYWNSNIILETCFERYYWGNRVRWFRIWYCQQHVVNICCCLLLKVRKFQNLPVYLHNWMCRFWTSQIKGYAAFSIVFYPPSTLIQPEQKNKQTHKHAYKHKSSFNNTDRTLQVILYHWEFSLGA